MSRVVAIGLDSVDHAFLNRLIGEGQLPNLAALRARAVRARLRIPSEYRSEAPWSDFGSGRASSSNRYWSTLVFEPETYRCPTIGAARAEPFYALGTERKVIALDVPHVRPHPEVQGLQVVGWGAHDPQFPRCSVPSGLLREIEMSAGRHRAGAVEYSGSWNQPDYLERLARVVIDGAGRRGAVVRLLVERCPDWDLLLVGISDGHQPGHQMWHGVDDRSPLSHASTAPLARESLVAIHRAIDASIGDILVAAGEATVVVFSLKGMEAADAEVVAPLLIPELLHRLHFGRPFLSSPAGLPNIPPPLVPRTSARPEWPAWQALHAERLRRDSLFGRSVARAERFLRRRLRGLRRSRAVRAPAADDSLHEPVDALSLEPVIGSVDFWHPACCYQEYWPKMRAFVIPSYSDVHLRINLAGREREGLVPTTDYDAACSEVERELRVCRDSRTGEPVFGKITRMRTREPLDVLGPGADIVAQCAGPTDVLDHPTIGRLGPFAFLRTGTHTAEGFAWVAGDAIRPGDVGEFPALDLPATLLELISARPPHPLDGEAIRALLPQLLPNTP